MLVRIQELPQKSLIGKSVRMSLTQNKTGDLWKSFMTQKSMIQNTVGNDLYSIQVYDEIDYFNKFSPQTEFTKWAGIEVNSNKNRPSGFYEFTIETGLYAVFLHKGQSSDFPKTMQFIFSQWLPKSEYQLDHRPHFELLGEKYKNNHQDSEEEVWVPIRLKS